MQYVQQNRSIESETSCLRTLFYNNAPSLFETKFFSKSYISPEFLHLCKLSPQDITILQLCYDSSPSTPDPDFFYETFIDRQLTAFENKPKLIKVMHLNTQSLVSNFSQFELKLSRYHFDVVALSETWLKENKLLLDYVNIPGYDLLYNNRETIRGSGVGLYVKQTLKHKR